MRFRLSRLQLAVPAEAHHYDTDNADISVSLMFGFAFGEIGSGFQRA